MFMGYVYLFMELDSEGNETFKIGITKNDPAKRIKQLQTGNPRTIRLVKFYQSQNYLKVERWLHRKYQLKTEAENEWRSLSNEEILSFHEDCKKADDVITMMLNDNPFYK